MNHKLGSELTINDVLEGYPEGHPITHFEPWHKPAKLADLPNARIAYSGTWGITIFDTDHYRQCDTHHTWTSGSCLRCYQARKSA